VGEEPFRVPIEKMGITRASGSHIFVDSAIIEIKIYSMIIEGLRCSVVVIFGGIYLEISMEVFFQPEKVES